MSLTIVFILLIAALFVYILISQTKFDEELAQLRSSLALKASELSELERRHSMLRDHFEQLVGAHEEGAVFEFLPKALADAYEFPFVWIDRIEPGSSKLQFANGYNQLTGQHGDPLNSGTAFSAMALMAGKGFLFHSRQQTGGPMAELPAQIASLLSIPLGVHDHQWAVLHLADRREHALTPALLKSLKLMTDLATQTVTHLRASEQLRFDEAGRRHLELLQTDAVVTIDKEGAIVAANAVFEDLFGYRSADVIGKNVSCLIPAEIAVHHDDYLDNYHRTGERHIIGIRRETMALHRDGHHFPIALEVHERETAGRTVYVALIRDLAERHRHLERIQAAQRQVKHAEDSIRQFMATVNHALRTPLNGVVGMADLMLETELQGEQRSYMLTLEDATLALIENLDGLQALSTPCELPESFSPAALLEELADLLTLRFNAPESRVFVQLSDQVPETVQGQLPRLRQALLHLAAFLARGQEQISVLLAVQASSRERNGLDFQLSVSPKLLERAQIDDALSGPKIQESHSLAEGCFNLNIARRLAELMNATLNFSESNTSQIFSLSLEVEHPSQEAIERPLVGTRVLVLEPDPTLAQALTALLGYCGCQAVSCEAEQAQRLMAAAQARNEHYHFVLYPLNLSHIFAKIGPSAPDTFFLVHCALGQRAEAVRLLEQGVSYCLTYPIKRKRLVDLMLNLLLGHQITSSQADPPKALPAKRLLLVEDNVINQKLMHKVLATLGLSCDLAVNGLEALHAVQNASYDLIIMDLNLPVMDGLEATAQIRALGGQHARVPILAMTADVQMLDAHFCALHKFDESLSKPIRVKELAAVLQRYLGSGSA